MDQDCAWKSHQSGCLHARIGIRKTIHPDHPDEGQSDADKEQDHPGGVHRMRPVPMNFDKMMVLLTDNKAVARAAS